VNWVSVAQWLRAEISGVFCEEGGRGARNAVKKEVVT